MRIGDTRWKLVAAVALGVVMAMPAAAEVTFENAWIRAAAPGQAAVAGYCDIANGGAEPATVIAFRDADCDGGGCPLRVEMHETVERDGMVGMRALPELVVGAGSTLSLAPGGKHLMVFGLDGGAAEARLRAVFDDGNEAVVRFVVRPIGHDRE